MFTISMAGYIFNIDNKYPYIYKMCYGYYHIPEADGIPVSVTETEILREKKDGYPMEMLEATAIHRKTADILMDKDILLCHGSVIAVDGKAYMFCAPSGTGKSTHARLWREMFGNRAVMVNDDKPFIKITEKGAIAYGSPWNGKHHLGSNIAVPLKAICLLERSTDNWVMKTDGMEAFPEFMRYAHRPADPMGTKKALELAEQLCRNTHIYHMGCNMEPNAPSIIYNGINEEENS